MSRVRVDEVFHSTTEYTMPTVLNHGAYSVESRFTIVQHNYMGGESGYRELLEIADPERGQRFIVHELGTDQHGAMHNFSEWNSLEDAHRAFPIWPRHDEQSCKKRKGFLCFVGGLYSRNKPWFYAGTNDIINGDWVIVLIICDGCNVRGTWEHRCHGTKPGSKIQVRGETVNTPCQCSECIEGEALFQKSLSEPS